MMSVKEYAEDINLSVEEIIKKAKSLDIDLNNEEDMLDQDMITILDSNLGVLEEEDDTPEEYIEEDILDEKVESLLESIDEIDDELKEQKLKKKSDRVKAVREKGRFQADKKKMYKNKEKLISNVPMEKEKHVFYYKEGMSIKDIAESLEVKTTELIMKLMNLGLMLTLNDSLSFEQTELLLVEYDKEVKRDEMTDELNFEMFESNDKEEDMIEKPPVVTIMGHVDHGKTTLLDTIRKTNVVGGEAGGITQAIGAYQVEENGKLITFIDTPGHAAFTEMRARGASITDIVIVIVAADDGVMPQTREAIDHAKAADVPIIVVVNKMDVPGANPDRVMNELAELGLTPDEWGGDTLYNKISALNGDGIPELLDNILLVAEMRELKVNPNRYAIGTVIESRLDTKIGTVATLLIENGTLRLGDPVVIGNCYCKVRTLINDKGEEIITAPPSTPVSVTGLSEVPKAGDKFMAFDSEKHAKKVAEKREVREKSKRLQKDVPTTLEDLFAQINEGVKEIKIILKADVHGSREAVKASLEKIEVEGAKVKVISAAVGSITESDVSLAKASNAILIGFNVRPDSKIRDFAKAKGVEIRLYNIIYKVVEEIEAAMKGMLDPEYEEKIFGTAEVRKLFKFSKVGTIAGCYVIEGIVSIDKKVRVVRDSVVVYDGEVNAIQKEKDQVKSVKKGIECGITVKNYSDIKEKDVLEFYDMVEIKR